MNELTMRQFIIYLLFAACFLALTNALSCPPGICSRVRCDGSAVANCDGRLDMHGGYCNCCPVCIKQLKENEICVDLMLFGIPQRKECRQGLQCDAESKVCKKMEMNPCHLETAKTQELLNSNAGMLVGTHLPDCTDDGFYKAKQCREAVCQCVHPDGTPITGFDNGIEKANVMNCGRFFFEIIKLIGLIE